MRAEKTRSLANFSDEAAVRCGPLRAALRLRFAPDCSRSTGCSQPRIAPRASMEGAAPAVPRCMQGRLRHWRREGGWLQSRQSKPAKCSRSIGEAGDRKPDCRTEPVDNPATRSGQRPSVSVVFDRGHPGSVPKSALRIRSARPDG